jgi:hypothetical protein
MAVPESSLLRKGGKIAALVFVWLFTAWLLYPLIFIDTVRLQDATKYFYRSSVGIIIMIILFGKTLFDLFFPLDTSRRKSVLQVVFLTVYALVMAGGIIIVLLRILLLYLKSDSQGSLVY